MNQLKHKDLGVQRGGLRGRKPTYHNVIDEKISKLMEINFQQRTETKIKWAVNCYNEWREMQLDRVDYEEEIYDANLNDISNLTKANLASLAHPLLGSANAKYVMFQNQGKDAQFRIVSIA